MPDVDFKLSVEWEDPCAATGEELRATWCRLSIRVGETPVTRVHDERAARPRREKGIIFDLRGRGLRFLIWNSFPRILWFAVYGNPTNQPLRQCDSWLKGPLS
jgi:hypothetical protein